jgi:hypothetical protein
MPLRKNFVFALFLLFSTAVFSQDAITSFATRRDSIDAIVAAMRKRNVVESKQIGLVGSPSSQYARYLYLQRFCTEQELVTLAADSNRCVKLYAYLALVFRKYNNISLVKETVMADNSEITLIETCVRSRMLVKQMPERMFRWYDANEIWVFERNMKLPGYCNKLFAALVNVKETVLL